MLQCPLGYTYTLHVTTPHHGTWWRCNTTIRDKTGKPKRCQRRVRTKVMNGYQMIEQVKFHDHHPAASALV